MLGDQGRHLAERRAVVRCDAANRHAFRDGLLLLVLVGERAQCVDLFLPKAQAVPCPQNGTVGGRHQGVMFKAAIGQPTRPGSSIQITVQLRVYPWIERVPCRPHPGDASPKGIDRHIPDQIADQSPIAQRGHPACPWPTPGSLHRHPRYRRVFKARR